MKTFEMFDSKPVAYYVYNASINLHDGTLLSRQITTDKDQLFSRIPNTVKSHVNLPSTDTGEGFIQVWYIVLENDKSYLYEVGTIYSTPVQVSGSLNDVKKEDLTDVPIEKYLQQKVKIWAAMYTKKEVVKLINELNVLVNDIRKVLTPVK